MAEQRAAERVVIYRRQCECDATASGPRVVQANAFAVGDVFQFQFQPVAMACDKCDTPWLEVESAD